MDLCRTAPGTAITKKIRVKSASVKSKNLEEKPKITLKKVEKITDKTESKSYNVVIRIDYSDR